MAVQEQKTTASGDLVLDSLEVKNFRAFRHLTIEKLGRVNLITGKNNVGKSSLLEALWLYAERGRAQVVRKLLIDRNELNVSDIPRLQEEFYIEKEFAEIDAAIKSFGFLFHDDHDIQNLQSLSIGSSSDGPDTVSLGINWIEKDGEAAPYLDVKAKDSSNTYRLDRVINLIDTRIRQSKNSIPCETISSIGANALQMERMWDQAVRTGRSIHILKLLRILLPNIEEIHFVGEPTMFRGRSPYVRLPTQDEAIPLARFGGGTIRLFNIASALANAKDGICCLDEIENGIHYSVLPEVWRFIFNAAHLLNVQVFATTHSWNCIEAFQITAGEDNDPASGTLIRLQNKNGNSFATIFDEDSLEIVTREGIEVR